MEAFRTLTAIAAALPAPNIDTDIIFPARFLLLTAKKGLGRYAFYEWRFDADGLPRESFVLNREPFRRAQILIAGDNFGCGSSREQAPWALRDFGIRAIVSTRFGEIFYANCFKNGIVPVVVDEAALRRLQGEAFAERPITVDLEALEIVCQTGAPIAFTVEAWRREALLHGRDEIALVLAGEGAAIDGFEARQRNAQPWLYTGE
jgi:3-isopropylmalate dehydratase small subunit